MSYLNEMNEAIARAARLQLKTPIFKPQKGLLLSAQALQEIPEIIRGAIGTPPAEEIAAQCLSYHARILPALSSYFGTELTYTIGYVSIGEETIFEHTEEQMKGLIKSGISKPQLNIHAWLTLPTCEILDFTLPTTYAVINKTKEGYGEVLAGHADHLLENVRYRPMLLGENHLRRIGPLLEF